MIAVERNHIALCCMTSFLDMWAFIFCYETGQRKEMSSAQYLPRCAMMKLSGQLEKTWMCAHNEKSNLKTTKRA